MYDFELCGVWNKKYRRKKQKQPQKNEYKKVLQWRRNWIFFSKDKDRKRAEYVFLLLFKRERILKGWIRKFWIQRIKSPKSQHDTK